MESAAIARRFVEGLNTFDLTAVRTMLTTGPHRVLRLELDGELIRRAVVDEAS